MVTILKTTAIQQPVIILLLLAALGVIALFTSGTLLSLKVLNPGVMLLIHRLASAIVILAVVAAVRLQVGVSLGNIRRHDP